MKVVPDKRYPYFRNGGQAWYSTIPDPTDDLDCGEVLRLVDSRVIANERAWQTYAQLWGYTGGHWRKFSKFHDRLS